MDKFESENPLEGSNLNPPKPLSTDSGSTEAPSDGKEGTFVLPPSFKVPQAIHLASVTLFDT